jgi:hypothetical protein
VIFLKAAEQITEFFIRMTFHARWRWGHNNDSVDQLVAPTFPKPGVVEFCGREKQSGRSRTEPETADGGDGGRHGVYSHPRLERATSGLGRRHFLFYLNQGQRDDPSPASLN